MLLVAYGQGSKPAVEPLPALAEPLALPDGELDDDAMPEPVVELAVELLAEPDGAAALLSRGCCVVRSRQCVVDDHLLSGEFIQFVDVDCAAAIAMVPPTKVEASIRVERDRMWSLLGVAPQVW